MLCSNFVKFGRREIGNIVRCRHRRKFWEVSYTECTGQANDFKLIPMVKMETRHPVQGSFGSEFPAICNYFGVMAAGNLKMPKRTVK